MSGGATETLLLLIGLPGLLILYSLGRSLWTGAVLRPFVDIRRARSPRTYWTLVALHIGALIAVGLGMTALLRALPPYSSYAEVECTALPSGQVRDCVVISESGPDAGRWAIEDVSRDCSAAVEPLDPVDPTTVQCKNGHPGYDKPLPRRFRATRSVIIY